MPPVAQGLLRELMAALPEGGARRAVAADDTHCACCGAACPGLA